MGVSANIGGGVQRHIQPHEIADWQFRIRFSIESGKPERVADVLREVQDRVLQTFFYEQVSKRYLRMHSVTGMLEWIKETWGVFFPLLDETEQFVKMASENKLQFHTMDRYAIAAMEFFKLVLNDHGIILEKLLIQHQIFDRTVQIAIAAKGVASARELDYNIATVDEVYDKMCDEMLPELKAKLVQLALSTNTLADIERA